MRVYLTNVEGICRRFVDEKRESLLRIKETTASFKAYWASQSPSEKKALVQHKGSEMLKVGFWAVLLVCSYARVLSQQNSALHGSLVVCVLCDLVLLVGIQAGLSDAVLRSI